MTATHVIPQTEGEFTPEEAQALLDSIINAPNLAGNPEYATRAMTYVQSIMSEWCDRMLPLTAQWRVLQWMLAGNTLCRSGPEDVHIPQLYKARETIVPRVEEQILERDPWFRIVPRQARWRDAAETNAAYIDWLFDQARVRDTVQPATRDALDCQAAIWYAWWENTEKRMLVREEKREWVDGLLKRSIDVTVKNQIVYSGMKCYLVDPFDFIVDTRCTNAQNALYIGHRVWVTVDEVRRLGKRYKWANLGKELDGVIGSTFDTESASNKWPRDPTAYADGNWQGSRIEGKPGMVELTFLFGTFDATGGGDYEDYQFVISGGKVIHEVRRNQHDKDMRPYAVGRISQNGHHFYGIGQLDNAVRLNQHLDRINQIALRGTEVAASPFVLAGEDSQLPDSLYKVRPFQVFKGAGDVQFTTVPDGFLRSATTMISFLQREINETVGAFPIQMGSDMNGGTATEATLSLQEGNRRTRGVIRGIANGLEQLLEITYALARQYSTQDVEVPVLGKRGLDLKKEHITISPVDLLPDVKFDLVGLHSLRTYGLKQAGYQMVLNSLGPLLVNDPNTDRTLLIHDVMEEALGPEDANRIVAVPTPLRNLKSQEEENEGLVQGAEIEVDEADPHEDHIKKMSELWHRANFGKMEKGVRDVVLKHRAQHIYFLQQKQVQKKVTDERNQARAAAAGQEAGGESAGASPQKGGFSADLMTGSPGGQSRNENPGPADANKAGRTGTLRQPYAQIENSP